MSEEIQSLFHSLSRELQEVLVLRERHRFSYDEIATILRIPRETVAARLALARSQMLQLLGRRDEPDGILAAPMTAEVAQ